MAAYEHRVMPLGRIACAHCLTPTTCGDRAPALCACDHTAHPFLVAVAWPVRRGHERSAFCMPSYREFAGFGNRGCLPDRVSILRFGETFGLRHLLENTSRPGRCWQRSMPCHCQRFAAEERPRLERDVFADAATGAWPSVKRRTRNKSIFVADGSTSWNASKRASKPRWRGPSESSSASSETSRYATGDGKKHGAADRAVCADQPLAAGVRSCWRRRNKCARNPQKSPAGARKLRFDALKGGCILHAVDCSKILAGSVFQTSSQVFSHQAKALKEIRKPRDRARFPQPRRAASFWPRINNKPYRTSPCRETRSRNTRCRPAPPAA